MIRKSGLLVLALMLVATMAFAGGGRESASATAAQPIRIGVAGAHSGDLASYGLPTVRAAELVVEQLNAGGGINGRRVQLFVEDDQCSPQEATNTAAKLVGEKVVAVIGHICSGATRTALGIYSGEKIPTISPSATNPTLAPDFPVFFRTIAPDDAQGILQAKFAAENLRVQRVAILHDGGDYGKGLADFAAAAFQANHRNVQIVLQEGVTVGAVDYSAIVNRIGASGAQAVIFGGYHPEASKIVGQMRTQGITIPFISGDGVKDDSFIQVAGAAAEGVYATGPMDTSANPMAAAARQAHQAKYGEQPGPFFMEGYAAAVAITSAIRIAGGTDADAVMNALRANRFDTPLGSIGFDAQGNVVGVGFAIYQVRSGRYVEVR